MLNKLINELCNPALIFVLFLILAKTFYVLGKERKAFLIFSVGLVWLLLVIITPLSQWLIFRLENQYAPFASGQPQEDKAVYILVLSGGRAYNSFQYPLLDVPSQTSARLVHGMMIHQQLPGSTLLASGNSLTIALALSNKEQINVQALGADESVIRGEEQENTKAEMEVYQRQIGDKGQLILVTSAMHMARAMLICKKKGIIAIPAPTDYRISMEDGDPKYDFYPSPQKMEMMQKALHEYLGLGQVYFQK